MKKSIVLIPLPSLIKNSFVRSFDLHRLSLSVERIQTAGLHRPSLSAERTQTADLHRPSLSAERTQTQTRTADSLAVLTRSRADSGN